MAILKGPTPGMIEDRRFAMFGLADKTQFTQTEYNELLAKYPDFNDFYNNTWKPYIELLKEDITSKTATKDRLENELVELQNKLADVQAKRDKIMQAIAEQQGINTATAQALIEMFNSELDELNALIDVTNDTIASHEASIANLDVMIAEYSAEKARLEQAINDYLTKVGGKNPLVG